MADTIEGSLMNLNIIRILDSIYGYLDYNNLYSIYMVLIQYSNFLTK